MWFNIEAVGVEVAVVGLISMEAFQLPVGPRMKNVAKPEFCRSAAVMGKPFTVETAPAASAVKDICKRKAERRKVGGALATL
jgi:hypothetical protein